MKPIILALALTSCSTVHNPWDETPEDLAVREAIERINSPEDESAPEGSTVEGEPK